MECETCGGPLIGHHGHFTDHRHEDCIKYLVEENKQRQKHIQDLERRMSILESGHLHY